MDCGRNFLLFVRGSEREEAFENSRIFKRIRSNRKFKILENINYPGNGSTPKFVLLAPGKN